MLFCICLVIYYCARLIGAINAPSPLTGTFKQQLGRNLFSNENFDYVFSPVKFVEFKRFLSFFLSFSYDSTAVKIHERGERNENSATLTQRQGLYTLLDTFQESITRERE